MRRLRARRAIARAHACVARAEEEKPAEDTQAYEAEEDGGGRLHSSSDIEAFFLFPDAPEKSECTARAGRDARPCRSCAARAPQSWRWASGPPS